MNSDLHYDGSQGFHIITYGLDCDGIGYIDTAGNVKWIKNYIIKRKNSNGTLYDKKISIRKSDKTFNIIGHMGRTTLFKSSADGDSLSNTVIPTTLFGFENVFGNFPVLTGTGSIIFDITCVNYNARPSCGLVEASASGSVLWEHRNDSLCNYQLAVVENGNFISVATPNLSRNLDVTSTVMTKWSPDHQQLWKKTISRGKPFGLYTKFNGLYTVVSLIPDTLFFTLIDRNSEIIKNLPVKIASGQPLNGIDAMIEIDTILPDTSIHMTGIYLFTVNPKIFERHIDASGHYIVPACTSKFLETAWFCDFVRIEKTVYAVTEDGFFLKMGINHPPRITRPFHGSTIDVREDFTFTETVTVIDTFPGERITLELLSGTGGGVSLVPNAGMITCSPKTEADSGAHAISVKATDRLGQSDTLQFTIHVTPINDAPVVSYPGLMRQVYEDDTAEVTAVISDEENDPLSIVWMRNERDILANGNGTLRYVPGLPCGRNDSVCIMVSDGSSTVKRSTLVPVLHRQIPPVVENPDSSSVTPDSMLRWSFSKGIDHKLDTTEFFFFLRITQYSGDDFTVLLRDSINDTAIRLSDVPGFDSLSNGGFTCVVKAYDVHGYSTLFSSVKTFIKHSGATMVSLKRDGHLPDRFFIGKKNKTVIVILPESGVPPERVLFACYDLNGRMQFSFRMNSGGNLKQAIRNRCAALTSGIHVFTYRYGKGSFNYRAFF